MIEVEGASFRPCPVVLLPSAAGFEATLDPLPRFHELVSRPSTQDNGADHLRTGMDSTNSPFWRAL
ncbi:hypothetical protein [Microvirga sp. Mcv34]|uniref:hypothetical protein n=1 Tax=Microvirga sp. Mcv34 TaxID=2926016 RepID=UPI0021CA6EFA|nr:hypothetical protein [Microvirga sp. Mcv34]